MKQMRLAMCVAVFAMIGGIAFSEDMDIRALQAKLAAQEARLNDLQAKIGSASSEASTAKNITSIRKNAKVTIGGQITTRYYFRKGKVKSELADYNVGRAAGVAANGVPYAQDNASNARGDMVTRRDYKGSDLRVANAKLEFKIDVNECFDAFIKLDLHDTGRGDVSGIAQNAWIRWKNLCGSGWGLLIGRDSLKFGPKTHGTVFDKWAQDQGPEGIGSMGGLAPGQYQWSYGEGMFFMGNMLPGHSVYGSTRTTQINPYWQNQDGTFRVDFSLIQAVDRRTAAAKNHTGGDREYDSYRTINYGLGSGTIKVNWKPIEGLDLFASVMNAYARNGRHNWWGRNDARSDSSAHNGFDRWNRNIDSASNNTTVNAGFFYNPCWMDRLSIFANYTYGWNEGWVKNLDVGTALAGASFKVTDNLTWFGMGEFLHAKNSDAIIWYKAKGWNVYTGLQYKLGYGVDLEGGYRYERVNYKDANGVKHTKFRGHTAYAQVNFNF